MERYKSNESPIDSGLSLPLPNATSVQIREIDGRAVVVRPDVLTPAEARKYASLESETLSRVSEAMTELGAEIGDDAGLAVLTAIDHTRMAMRASLSGEKGFVRPDGTLNTKEIEARAEKARKRAAAKLADWESGDRSADRPINADLAETRARQSALRKAVSIARTVETYVAAKAAITVAMSARAEIRSAKALRKTAQDEGRALTDGERAQINAQIASGRNLARIGDASAEAIEQAS